MRVLIAPISAAYASTTTLAAITGVKLPNHAAEDSADLLPVLLGKDGLMIMPVKSSGAPANLASREIFRLLIWVTMPE